MRFFKKSKSKLLIDSYESNQSFFDLEQNIFKELKSMIEVSFEYAGWNDREIDSIYVFNSTEEGNYFTFFFKIKELLVDRHEVNNHLDKSCDVSETQQFAADDIGLKNLLNIVDLLQGANQPIPTRLTIEFSPKTNKMISDFNYEKRLVGTDLMESDLENEWKEKLSENK